jgi:6,7-dimethyl-8-ribityllumazine synthase
MSKALPPKPRVFAPKSRVCIVASKYNEVFTDALVDNAVAELGELLPQGRIDVVRVPGAFEVPVIASQVIERVAPDCVICLGLILRGDTAHADLVATAVTTALMELSVRTGTPVVHEVLLCTDEKQAYARCIGESLNRGREAARVAAAMIDISYELNRTMPRAIPRHR